jgi:molybdopterin-guanine dinucleotide biosynthesis protein A
MNFSAVILAGGQSRRMGRDKAWLPVKGQPLLLRQIDLVRQLAPMEVFISGRPDTDYTPLKYPVLHDCFADAGPLAGIERALTAASAPLLLVVAVDLPCMTASLLQQLGANCLDGAGVIPRVNGRVEPLAAFYPTTAQSLAESLLRNSRYYVTAFAEHCLQARLANFYDLSTSHAESFTNLNTPMDGTALQ